VGVVVLAVERKGQPVAIIVVNPDRLVRASRRDPVDDRPNLGHEHGLCEGRAQDVLPLASDMAAGIGKGLLSVPPAFEVVSEKALHPHFAFAAEGSEEPVESDEFHALFLRRSCAACLALDDPPPKGGSALLVVMATVPFNNNPPDRSCQRVLKPSLGILSDGISRI